MQNSENFFAIQTYYCSKKNLNFEFMKKEVRIVVTFVGGDGNEVDSRVPTISFLDLEASYSFKFSCEN